MKNIYLDWNSYGIIHPKVLDKMKDVWENYSNPMSKHELGQKSKKYLYELEHTLKTYLDAHDYNIIFTSGATEANVNVLKNFQNVYVSDIEHPSIHGCPYATIINVDSDAQLDYNALEEQLKILDQPFLVSYMLANHETGIINDLTKIRALCDQYGGFLHTDAVQAFGRMAVSLKTLNPDYLTICAHKFGGPIGIGAIFYKDSAPMKRFSWGKQIRSGTYAMPLIAGMVESLNIPPSSNAFLENLLNKDLIIGFNMPRLSNTTCIKCNNQTLLLMELGMSGIFVSSGAACTSGESDRAHSVYAMGIESDTIRISSGWKTSQQDFKTIYNKIFLI